MPAQPSKKPNLVSLAAMSSNRSDYNQKHNAPMISPRFSTCINYQMYEILQYFVGSGSDSATFLCMLDLHVGIRVDAA